MNPHLEQFVYACHCCCVKERPVNIDFGRGTVSVPKCLTPLHHSRRNPDSDILFISFLPASIAHPSEHAAL